MGAEMVAPIAGSVIGGVMGNKAAKKQADATRYAAEMNARGYEDARPYIKDMYEGGTKALNDALEAGYYSGDTYAGMNDMQRNAMNQMYGFGNRGFTGGQNLMDAGAGFGTNYADLYNAAGGDRMATARQYAMDNSQPLVDAALRDSTRNLQENTLRNIGMGASGTGNTNSSRAGVAEAIAGRAYADRAADVSAGISDNLMRRSLAEQNTAFRNQMAANQGLGGAYTTGFGMGTDAGRLMGAAGDAMQKDEQMRLNERQKFFEGDRDFALDQYNKYNAGILGRAPQTSRQSPNLVDPTMAGLSGAMAGFGFGQKYLSPMFNQQTQAMPASPTPMAGMGSLRGYFSQ